MYYDRRTKNQHQKLPQGHEQGARRGEPERFVHRPLPFMPSHVVGCCLLPVTAAGAPGTGLPAQPAWRGHPLPRHARPGHPAALTVPSTVLPKAPRAAEAWSSPCQAGNRSSSEGCTIFNNHLVIIIMQKRDTAVNRCNCCIYPWYALNVQSLSVIRLIRIHLRWFVAIAKKGRETDLR